MVERQFAEQLEVTPEAAGEINQINDEAGVRWLKSFLSADKRKTFCLYVWVPETRSWPVHFAAPASGA